jgi:hypothetical protein
MAVGVINSLLRRPKGRRQLAACGGTDIHLEKAAGYVLIVCNNDPDPLIHMRSPFLPKTRFSRKGHTDT